jgi:HAE1 family hydrophobic/amphiphilic exporter-1
MFSIFFIRRPVFAMVISIVTLVVGGIALLALPVARYPDIAPPTVSVSAIYPGANARTVADTVATPIEQEVNGVEGMIYMSSVSANDGTMNLTVTFEPGTDLDTANVLTQNRVSVAESRLPEEVKRQGVTVKKKSTDTVMYLGFSSPNGTYDDQFLSNFVWRNIRDELARVNGVGDVQVFGVGQFSMRIWLNPDLLKTYNLAVDDVLGAIRQQNIQVAGGRVGSAPATPGTSHEYTVNIYGRLTDQAEFENIVVKINEDGGFLRVRDVARVELGSDLYNFSSQLNGKPAATVAIYQIPGTNIMDVAGGISEKMAQIKKDGGFPNDLEYSIVYDNTDVIRASIKSVVTTLIAALILVILTVFIFLQNVRATIIPAVTIPVSLVGTFAVLLVFGYSLNQLTLFGLVLVIGIVVDDAIVVVENTTRWINEGLSSREAAEKAMLEVSGPVIATTLVLLAVFVPTIFMGGITGTLFKQFAVTISIATVFSSINALTLSPALCAILLRPQTKEPRGAFRWFNVTLDKSTNAYLGTTKLAIRRSFIAVLLFIGMTALAIYGLGRLPTGFVPQEDEGYCIIAVQLPDAASLERTKAALNEINEIVKATEGTGDYLTITGYSLIDGAASASSGFVIATFDPWSERPGAELHQSAIIQSLNARLSQYQDAMVFAFPVPSLPGLGTSGGFTFMLQDKSSVGLDELFNTGQKFIADGNAQSGLNGLNSTFRVNVPQLFVDIDREQVMRTGTPMKSVFDAIQVNLGSAYVNDFTYQGRIYKVTAQADAKFRDSPEDINGIELRGASGEMIPLGAIANVERTYGPQSVTRFNLFPSMKILGSAAPGYSSGDALDLVEDMADESLPDGMGYAWSELSYQEKLAAGGTTMIFVLAILMVYLVLAAQYESWTIPIAVVLSIPTALLGAVLAVWIRDMDNNVYTQIGIVLLIGLSTKSAILIVEFAKVLRDEGKTLFDSAIEATRLRFRAVLMTAFSFILGVIPLLVTSGAGAESQKVIGTAVFGGMIAATVLSLAAVPMLFYVVQRIAEGKKGRERDA